MPTDNRICRWYTFFFFLAKRFIITGGQSASDPSVYTNATLRIPESPYTGVCKMSATCTNIFFVLASLSFWSVEKNVSDENRERSRFRDNIPIEYRPRESRNEDESKDNNTRGGIKYDDFGIVLTAILLCIFDGYTTVQAHIPGTV